MIDAGACGLPLVVSDRMRATERIRGNGFSYRQGDPVALSRVLERLEARQIRETMGQVGATRIAESYSWNRIAADRVDDYRFSLARLARNV
jgi:glycosyltransferase involved in cell wall biosynthesis